MNLRIRVKKRRLLIAAIAVCSMGAFYAFSAHAETLDSLSGAGAGGWFAKGDMLSVETGMEDGYQTMEFTCLDTDYHGGYLFVADDVIPYSLGVRYAQSSNDYSVSDVRTWLNQSFADTLSVADELLPVKLAETDDSISDRVFCLSVEEVKNPSYKEITRKTWSPIRGMRYYWTRTPRENTDNQAYMVQYNGHIASSRVSLTEAGIRPAFVLLRETADTSQGKIWYEGDTQERVLHGKPYRFRCIDPDYCDAGMNRAGALFVCDTILGGNLCAFDDMHNGWEASDLRFWLNEGIEDKDGLAKAVTTINFTYAGKSRNYQLAEKDFTKRRQPGSAIQDQMFCLSLEEALRYSGWLWKLGGSSADNYTEAGSHTMGYWLRTPAAGDGTKSYAVTYDGRVAPEEVNNKKIGFRPAFVAVQE